MLPGQAGGHVLLGQDPGVGQSASADLEGPDLVGWLNCECFFSLVLVGLLAALPFNLHCNGRRSGRHNDSVAGCGSPS